MKAPRSGRRRLGSARRRCDLTAGWAYALRLLAGRERSEREIRERLREWGLSAVDIDASVDRLRRFGYLDDTRFAESMARRAVRRGHGRLRLRAELAAKGVAAAIIEPVVADAYADEQDLARQLLRKRYKTPCGSASAKARAARFLRQRGFPRPVVLAILKKGC